MPEKILLEQKEGVGTLTLNNPQKMNCMGYAMLEAMERVLREIDKNEEIRVLLIKGAGDRSFSSGADLKEFGSLDMEQSERWIRYGNRVFNALESLSLPTVALINGYALGGGLELALCCDFRLGTEKAVLGAPELKHGWLPGWGGMTRLRRLLGEAKAKEVVMLSQHIPANHALAMGLLTKILNPGAEDLELKTFTGHLAGLNPIAFGLAKKALMDEARSTLASDVDFDVMAMHTTKNQP